MEIINNRKQLVENYIQLYESNNTTLFHYDADKYKVGDIITKDNSKFISTEVIKAYKNITELDVSKVVYCRDFVFDNNYMDEEYDYCYEVSSIGSMFKGYISFNADMCMEALKEDCNTMTREEIIKEFSLAYRDNDFASQDNLLAKFPNICRPLSDYPTEKERYEYICDKVQVNKIC